MKAIHRVRYGGPEVLRLVDAPTPEPRKGHVLVRVRAAGVDAGAWHLMTGTPHLARLALGLRAPRDPSLGTDLAGIVERVGEGVTTLKPGDEVFGVAAGTFAEFAVARADKLAIKPAGVDWEQAAALPVSGATALEALASAGDPRAGSRVLVIGAGGGVGHLVVQLAARAGCHVTAVCGPAKADLVRGLGADEVIDYTRDDFAADRGADGTRRERFDVILVAGGYDELPRLRRALTERGTLVLIGGEGGSRIAGALDRTLAAQLRAPFTRQRLRGLIALTAPEHLVRLGELAASGELRAVVSRALPLADAAVALREIDSGHATGKIVLLP